ncbi:antitoxin [Streptomyces sp. ISL-90]|nr:antitoxin [Streptomyces sp. ISL-90]
MPVTITIRAVPDEVRDELAARAARGGQSLQEYLSGELEALAARPSALEAVMRARTRARTYPPFGAADLLADIDADRR